MLLIVGLGNIGSKYAYTRHNAGFIVLDALAKSLGSKFSLNKSFYSELSIHKNFILCKPHTYMNLSGDALLAVKNYYKIEDVLVVHDDIDLALGSIRFKKGGGSGGHNGLKSIIAQLGQEFWRLRFGVGRGDFREHFSVSEYVLSNFDSDISELVKHCVSAITALLDRNFSYVQNNFTLK